MLQQTQVSRVLEKFGPFIERFPSVRDLAAASEQEVLAAWSGLGYYSRGRNLRRAAIVIVQRFGARVPSSLDELRTLPGVGRYTAGAIASLVFEQPAPIVDGNVRRVLVRVEGVGAEEHARPEPRARHPERAARADDWVWERSESLVRTAHRAGVVAPFNEGMMELGALVCTPRAPKCGECPLASHCVAKKHGVQELIPPPKKRARVSELRHDVALVHDVRRGVLVERRPDSGLWAGMWQALTRESDDAAAPEPIEIARWCRGESATLLESFDHKTTHRLVRFAVWRVEMKPRARPARGEFVRVDAAGELPMSNPQRRIFGRWVIEGSARAIVSP